MQIKKLVSVAAALFIALPAAHAFADGGDPRGNTECPVGLVNGLTLDQEFGTGAGALTRCIKKRHHVQVVVEINRYCRTNTPNATCTSPDALGNMQNMLDDYEITDGMTQGLDYEMIAVVHSGGGFLLLKDPTLNKFQSQVQALMDRGVTFYFCQNTVRGFIKAGTLTQGDAVNQIMDGVKFVTAGFTAMADFEALGWSPVTP